jgi:methanogenic corrinoid protein MtbC1
MDKVGQRKPGLRPAPRARQAAPKAQMLSIAAVERETGLGKETLRVWERRYGFPAPKRDAQGERAYSLAQIEKLRVVKRLMDAGHRPGRLAPMSIAALHRLSGGSAPSKVEPAAASDLDSLLALLRANDVARLRAQLGQASVRMGLATFVTEVIAPLNTLVGAAWMRGEIEIFHEHSYTETAQAVLRAGIHSLPEAGAQHRPRIVLGTLPGEPHGLGLLMAEALFAAEGAQCFSLGVQTPVWDLALATEAYSADLLALSFTGCINAKQIAEGLAELRAKLPASVEIWAGGSAPVLRRRPVPGVTAMSSLTELAPGLQRWRAAQA